MGVEPWSVVVAAEVIQEIQGGFKIGREGHGRLTSWAKESYWINYICNINIVIFLKINAVYAYQDYACYHWIICMYNI
jgi:hypothetical protein